MPAHAHIHIIYGTHTYVMRHVYFSPGQTDRFERSELQKNSEWTLREGNVCRLDSRLGFVPSRQYSRGLLDGEADVDVSQVQHARRDALEAAEMGSGSVDPSRL